MHTRFENSSLNSATRGFPVKTFSISLGSRPLIFNSLEHVRDTRAVASEQNIGRFVSDADPHLHLTAAKKEALPTDGCMLALTPNFRTTRLPRCFLSSRSAFVVETDVTARCAARACSWQATLSALMMTAATSGSV